MKKIIILISIILGISDQLLSQDTIITELIDSANVVQKYDIRETRLEIVRVRDTVFVQPDSLLVTSIEKLLKNYDKLKKNQELNASFVENVITEGRDSNDKFRLQIEKSLNDLRNILEQNSSLVESAITEERKLNDQFSRLILLVLIINIISTSILLYLNKKNRRITPRKYEPEKTDDIVSKPALEAYNASINEFVNINNHIYDLRKKETKGLVIAMYRYLALHSTDKNQLLSEIREADVSDDIKEQFVALVSRINNFLIQKKPIIDAWLKCTPEDCIDSYESAVRMPEELVFDDCLDEDVLGDNIEGQKITMVHKVGFYFPGNTIKPYREKSIVSV